MEDELSGRRHAHRIRGESSDESHRHQRRDGLRAARLVGKLGVIVVSGGSGREVLAVPATGAPVLRGEYLVPRLRVLAPRPRRGAMTVWIEPPPGWGPRQKLLTELERLGYHVDMVGAGDVWRLVLH